MGGSAVKERCHIRQGAWLSCCLALLLGGAAQLQPCRAVRGRGIEDSLQLAAVLTQAWQPAMPIGSGSDIQLDPRSSHGRSSGRLDRKWLEMEGVPSPYEVILDQTNAYRAQHHAPPLQWNGPLAADAARWASQCAFMADPVVTAGESIFASSLTDNLPYVLQTAVDLWYKQSHKYDWNEPGYGFDTGAFSQLVWKSTTHMGCAAAVCKRGIKGNGWQKGTLVVCRYLPQGNNPLDFEQNVLPSATPPAPAPARQTQMAPKPAPKRAESPRKLNPPALKPEGQKHVTGTATLNELLKTIGSSTPALTVEPVRAPSPTASSVADLPKAAAAPVPAAAAPKPALEPAPAVAAAPKPAAAAIAPSAPAPAPAAAPITSQPPSAAVTPAPVPAPAAAPQPTAPSSPTTVPTTGTSANSSTLSNPSLTYALALHNMYRKDHLANPLIWNEVLAAGSAEQASKCTFGSDPSKIYGENIFVSLSHNTTQALADAMEFWYGGLANYDFTNPGYQEGTARFTQMVWRTSFALGCAAQQCNSGIMGTLVVCRYAPPGNQGSASDYLANVKPLQSPVKPSTALQAPLRASIMYAPPATVAAAAALPAAPAPAPAPLPAVPVATLWVRDEQGKLVPVQQG